MNPESMTWLSRREVQQLFGGSYDRVRRADEEGRLPGRRNRGAGASLTATVEYPLAELIEAGLVDPLSRPAVTPPVEAGEPDMTELGYLRQQVADLQVRLERRDAEFDRLARMLELAMGRAT